MKTLLVSLSHIEKVDDVIQTAAYIARQFNAHVIGYFPIPGPTITVFTHPGAFMPLDDRVQKIYEEKAAVVQAKFEDRMKKDGLKFEWRQERLVTTDITSGVVGHGHESDLIIMSQDDSGTSTTSADIRMTAEVVLSAGRPVLVVPPLNGKEPKIDKVVAGWNASRESCRAAFDSVPLLQLADDVHLTWVNPEKTIGNHGKKIPGAELGAALARHNVNVTTKGLSNRSKAGQALLTYARDEDADLLVLGAYGHSRIRERILGGATEFVLRNMKLPVLLSN